jgi:hypothetical protein
MKHIVQSVRPVPERIDDMSMGHFHPGLFDLIPLGQPDDYMTGLQETVDIPVRDVWLTINGFFT